MSDVVVGDDGLGRCRWGAGDARYREYHDTEWGRPVVDERGLYEKLCLEALQSGLSWALILRKREDIRAALAERLHGEVEAGGELVYEALPQNPFAVFGGLGGAGTPL